MYSQRYGTPPVVHATGGLIDTVVDCTPASLARSEASGFVFGKMDAASLLLAVRRALKLYQDKKSWFALQQICMSKDFGWGSSAKAYQQIYNDLIK
jgi:starch synthase